MKVPGSDGNDKVGTRMSEVRANEHSAVRRADNLIQHVAREEAGDESSSSDTVSFSLLGTLMRRELNPTTMAEERKAKIEALKQAVKEGRYAPSSEAVAGSVAQELSLEVLLSGGALRNS